MNLGMLWFGIIIIYCLFIRKIITANSMDDEFLGWNLALLADTQQLQVAAAALRLVCAILSALARVEGAAARPTNV